MFPAINHVVQPPKESSGDSCSTQIIPFSFLAIAYNQEPNHIENKKNNEHGTEINNEIFQTTKVLVTGTKFVEDKYKPNNYMAEL